jgi:thioredoxin 1
MELQTKEELLGVINSGNVVFIDFYGSTCGPCKMFVPTFDRLVNEYNPSGKAKVAKIEVYERPDVAEMFGIKSLPTLIFFKDGAEVTRLTGGQRIGDLKTEMERLISGEPRIEQTDDF